MLGEHAKDSRNARRAYQRFVENGIVDPPSSPVEAAVGGVFLGKSSWVEQMRERLADEPDDANVPQRKRLAKRPTEEEIVRLVQDHFGVGLPDLNQARRHGRLFDSLAGGREGNHVGGTIRGRQRGGALQITKSRRVTTPGRSKVEPPA